MSIAKGSSQVSRNDSSEVSSETMCSLSVISWTQVDVAEERLERTIH